MIPSGVVRDRLEQLVTQYECPDFIASDPISIPHLFTKNQDIEISALFAAIFSWGQRKTIINKSRELMQLMDFDPHQFVLHHSDEDLKRIISFKHRTFQYEDLLYFISFLQYHYSKYDSLESAFLTNDLFANIEQSLHQFYQNFFSLTHFPRTKKHISHPGNGSTCKRLCMYLRWMVRSSIKGVDFGIWSVIKPKDLVIPLDVHVHRVAYELRLLSDDDKNWKAAKALTNTLQLFDPNDPVKFDFALFNLGIQGDRL